MRKITVGLLIALFSIAGSGSTCLPVENVDAGVDVDAGDTPVDAGDPVVDADAGSEVDSGTPDTGSCVDSIASFGFEAACNECFAASCCSEVDGCFADDTCRDACLVDPEDPACAEGPSADAFNALVGCFNDNCAEICNGGAQVDITPSCDDVPVAPSNGSCVTIGDGNVCNPITNEGCTEEGSVCDFGANGFECYPPPNDSALCQACNVADGPFCGAGLTCVNDQCVAFCCTNEDCGTGTCDTTFSEDGSFGLCVESVAAPE